MTSVDLSAVKPVTAGIYTVAVSSNGLTGPRSTVTITAGTASKVSANGVLANLPSGSNLGTITASIEDTSGNTVTNSTGTVKATITGPNGYSRQSRQQR